MIIFTQLFRIGKFREEKPDQTKIKTSKEEFIRSYDLNSPTTTLLGINSNTRVYKVQNKLNKMYYACKQIKNGEQIKLPTLQKEYESLKALQSYNHLIKMNEIYQFQESKIPYIYLIEELADQSLTKFVEALKFDNATIIRLLFESLSGLYYLKSQLMIHKSIKPENILIKNQEIKIDQFGSTTISTHVNDMKASAASIAGSHQYLSPKLYDSYKSGNASCEHNPEKSDVFSLGLVFLQMKKKLAAINYQGKNSKERQTLIEKDLNSLQKDFVYELLVKMLAYEEKARFNFSQLLKTFYFREKVLEALNMEYKKLYQQNETILHTLQEKLISLESQQNSEQYKQAQLELIERYEDKLDYISKLDTNNNALRFIYQEKLLKKREVYDQTLEQARSQDLAKIDNNQFVELVKRSFNEIDQQDIEIKEELWCDISRRICEQVNFDDYYFKNQSELDQLIKNMGSNIQRNYKQYNKKVMAYQDLKQKQSELEKKIAKRIEVTKQEQSKFLKYDEIVEQQKKEILQSKDELKLKVQQSVEEQQEKLQESEKKYKRSIDELKVESFELKQLRSKDIEETKNQFEALKIKVMQQLQIQDAKIKNLEETQAKDKVEISNIKQELKDSIIEQQRKIKIVLQHLEGFISGFNDFKEFLQITNQRQRNKINKINLDFGHEKGERLKENEIKFIGKNLISLQNLEILGLNLKYQALSQEPLKLICDGVSQLTILQRLDLNLYYNQIGQSGCQYLMGALAKLTDLQQLNLNLEYNKIDINGATQISVGLSQLTKLTHLNLDLGEEKIGNDGTKFISEAISKLISLKSLSLNLSGNDITGVGVNYISDNLSKLAQLKKLDLNFVFNEIDDNGAQYTGKLLLNLPQLEELGLNISDNKIGENGAKPITIAIAKMSKLQILKFGIGHNEIGDKGIQTIGQEFAQMHYLKELYLDFGSSEHYWSCITEAGAKEIGLMLTKLISLEKLDLNLQRNQIKENDTKNICDGIAQLKKLKYLTLDFSECGISDNGAKHLSEVLSKLTQLQQLSLNLMENNIAKTSTIQIGQMLEKMTQLTSLDLDLASNDIDEAGANSICDVISKLTQLQKLVLDLHENGLWCQVNIQIYLNLQKMSELQELNLHLDGFGEITALGQEEVQKALHFHQKLLIEIPKGKTLNAEVTKKICESLLKLESLSSLKLDFSGKQVGEQGAKIIAGVITFIEKLKQLQSLEIKLEKNKIVENDAKNIVSQLFKLTKLQELKLNLSENNLGNYKGQIENDMKKNFLHTKLELKI